MILVSAALPAELDDQFKGIDVLFTGIGKINAAIELTRAIEKHKGDVELVINFGTAGSSYWRKGTLLLCDRIFERDMVCHLPEFRDTNPQHLPTSLMPMPGNLEPVACFTSDTFMEKADLEKLPGDSIADMEAFALAKVCWKYGVRFTSVKMISDGEDLDARGEEIWREHRARGAKQFRTIYDFIVRGQHDHRNLGLGESLVRSGAV